MLTQACNIWEGYSGPYKPTAATLTTYVLDNSPEIDSARRQRAVLVLPGGGYQMTSDREAEPVALAFAGAGFSTFVLRYSCAPAHYPTQLLEASRAMWLIRQRAEEWHIDTEHITVLGFSAGGHLAANLAVGWNDAMIERELGMPHGQNRPGRAVLCYAVISAQEPWIHAGSFQNVLGGDANQSAKDWISLEKRVSADTPPVFLWHTFNDDVVPVENSLLFAGALAAANVPFELHVYPEGPHGLSLCDERTAGTAHMTRPYVAGWLGHCVAWLNLDDTALTKR